MNNFKLCASLQGHESDVRALAVYPGGDIVTASRDGCSRLWEKSNNSHDYNQKVVYMGHSNFVTSTCIIHSHEENTDGFTVTGSKDSTILVFKKYSSKPVHTLCGHNDAVSCLIWGRGILISGSWDHSVKIWKNWSCISTSVAHTGPVWALAAFDSTNSFISASADKTIALWKDGKKIVTYNGHTDCVRGLSILDENKFLSCSNDASVRLWNVKTGDCLASYFGHTNYIYSIDSFECGGFVTGSEDRTIKIWDSHGNNISTIFLPAQSVWCVSTLPNNDIAAGSSDSVCRVFTSSDRQVSEEMQKNFEESVSKFKVAVEDIGDIKKSELPGKEILFKPGKRDGQTVMVRDGEKVFCHIWSLTKSKWENVGEVVGGTGGSASSSGKILHEGRECDYVFDVDLDEERVLKLPYNKGEDPWIVAQSFIHRHELSQDYLEQVANFIRKNADVSANKSSLANRDPFTSNSSYSTSFSHDLGDTQHFNGTGTVKSQYFPQQFALKFDTFNKEGILSKLDESNDLVSDPLSKEQVLSLVTAVSSTSVVVEDLIYLEKALQWPKERIWPVLDVLRLALRSENAQAKWLKEEKGNALSAILKEYLTPPVAVPAQLMSLRCLCNMTAYQPGIHVLRNHLHSLINLTITTAPYVNKNLEIAAATLFLNFATMMRDADLETMCQLLSGISTVTLLVNDPEAQFRILIALGTLLTLGSKDILMFAKSLDLKPVIQKMAAMNEPKKVCECASDILAIL